jgi:hypothetical protein
VTCSSSNGCLASVSAAFWSFVRVGWPNIADCGRESRCHTCCIPSTATRPTSKQVLAPIQMFSFLKLPALALLLLSFDLVSGAQIPADSVASQYSLTTSTTLPFPTATQSTAEADSFIVSQWSLSKGRIQNGPNNIAFVDDPFPNVPVSALPGSTNTTSPVLAITYPQGSFSSETSGVQLYSLWNATAGQVFQSMMVSYDIAFDSGFDWVKGGKLPGLRGGPNSTGCSGGNEPNGTDCFSARVMWRVNGKGEGTYVYRSTEIVFDLSLRCSLCIHTRA